ncbi:MAG: hypothetical protein M9962_14005 [Oligoflexia bacterium]|nr:hypothetical protein [Oligoflexia bacterium]
MKTIITITMLLSSIFCFSVEAKTIRATELSNNIWDKINSYGSEEITVEFRQGDELPVSFYASGDLLETSREGSSYIRIKRDFWIRLKNEKVTMSLDNREYKPLSEMLMGSFQAGAGSEDNGGIAHIIRLNLDARLK